METMIANLIEAYRQSITELDWMTPATQKEALAKLAKFTPKIGYPNQVARLQPRWRSRADDLIGNVERANRLEHEYQVSKLGKPVDRDEWLMTPQTVNAYYNPVKNEIVFPAAILQPPFFDVDGGRCGELRSDRRGHRPRDRPRLRRSGPPVRRRRQAARLVDAGRRDGVPEAREAARRAVQRVQPAARDERQRRAHARREHRRPGRPVDRVPRVEDLARRASPRRSSTASPAISASSWAGRRRGARRRAKQYLRRQVLADPHAWAEFRANGPLGNIPEFYEAFGVKPGDKLYREPEKRVKIW